MKITKTALQKFIQLTSDWSTICDALTFAGIEIEECVLAGTSKFSGVFVGLVVECIAHPNATRLSVCVIDNGPLGCHRVVCGASNVRQGLLVAHAMPGAKLPGHEKTIQEVVLRGEPSYGMCCSCDELGLTVQTNLGIWELDQNFHPGDDLSEKLGLNDASMLIKVTPNRGDCLSILGIARDIALLGHGELYPEVAGKVIDSNSYMPHQAEIPVSVQCSQECPLYIGMLLQNVDLSAVLPLEISQYFVNCGLRFHNAIVDLTNWVMFLYGQPMHAFDADCIEGGVHVRQANESTGSVVLLDGQEVSVKPGTVLVCDDVKVLAIAGVMGCLSSAVTNKTKSVFLEAIWLDPEEVRGQAHDLGVHSEATHRYERHVDVLGVFPALHYVANILVENCQALAGAVTVCMNADYWPHMPRVSVTLTAIHKVVGYPLEISLIESLMTRLPAEVHYDGDHTWNCQAYSYRSNLSTVSEYVQEILRLWGYDKLPDIHHMPSLPATMIFQSADMRFVVAQRLATLGCSEVVTSSFVHSEVEQVLYKESPVLVNNPISALSDALRSHLLTSLLPVVKNNKNRGEDRLALFEIGTVFSHANTAGVIKEAVHWAGIMWGGIRSVEWGREIVMVDFFTVKKIIQNVLAPIEVSFLAVKDISYLHPGRSAGIYFQKQCLGVIGELHPQICQEHFNVVSAPIVYEVDFSLFDLKRVSEYRTSSIYPASTRDLSFFVNKNIAAQKMCDIFVSLDFNDIAVQVEVFDFYQGINVPEGQVSISFRFLLKNMQRTLLEQDIEGVTEKIISAAVSHFGARLRDKV